MESTTTRLREIEAQVDEWLNSPSGPENRDLIAQMFRTVRKLVDDETSRGDLKILNRALRELRYAFKIFAPHRFIRKVSIFGSTRVAENNPYYQMAKDFGRRLAEEGYMVITGAGPGIMQAGHEGAGQDKSFGVNIRLPSVQQANRVIRGDPKLITFRYFFTRKLIFVKEADAFVFFPGGYGTQDELIETLTLAQTGKSQLVPILLMDLPGQGYWEEWAEFVRVAMLRSGYISESELSFFTIISDIETAVAEIKGFYRNYHSYRFVGRDLVIRLNHSPTPSLIDTLSCDFVDILKEGTVKQTEPLPEESDDPATLHLHRLRMHFNREDFARLRQMINVINRY